MSDLLQEAISVLECILALDMPYREGKVIFDRHGYDESLKVEIPPSIFIAMKAKEVIEKHKQQDYIK